MADEKPTRSWCKRTHLDAKQLHPWSFSPLAPQKKNWWERNQDPASYWDSVIFPGRTVKLWGGNRVSELDSENQGWLDKTILSFSCPEKTTFEGLKLAVKAFLGGQVNTWSLVNKNGFWFLFLSFFHSFETPTTRLKLTKVSGEKRCGLQRRCDCCSIIQSIFVSWEKNMSYFEVSFLSFWQCED